MSVACFTLKQKNSENLGAILGAKLGGIRAGSWQFYASMI